MEIIIDSKKIICSDSSKNLVQIGEENGLSFIAPCFRNKKKYGCCYVCIVEVNGEHKYACITKPSEGMLITYNREDLSSIRKERLQKYADAIKACDSSHNISLGKDENKPDTCCAVCDDFS